MPYPPEHRDQTRARIVRSAMALFNRHGFEQVSIDDVMRQAGLTRGGFYSYFRAKSELYAASVALSLSETPWSRWDGVSVDFAAEDAAAQIVDAYLSRQHFEDVDGSCPMVALPGDAARGEPEVRRAFERVFRAMTELFEESLRSAGRPDRARAIAIAGICVGAMVVARAVESTELADAIRRSSRRIARELGGWSDGNKKRVLRRRGRPKRSGGSTPHR